MARSPFQFGLRAVFGIMSAAAFFAFLGVPGPEERVAALAVVAAWAVIVVLSLGILAALVLSVSMTFYHVAQLCRRPWSTSGAAKGDRSNY